MSYLKPDATPTEARMASYESLNTAVARLRELADELLLFRQGDAVYLKEHGDAYAEHESSKSTLIQKVESATRDIGRIQINLIDAVAMAVRA